ncbi:T9SS type A sorting domain-containing protein [Bacteroidota bacterium]
MTKSLFALLLIALGSIAFSQDWDGFPVPADPGEGKVWQLQSLSDDFNYDAPADNKGAGFSERWTDSYHNAWTGPGLTIWNSEHSFVADGLLQLIASRVPGTNKVYTGIITSKERIIHPVYAEARAKISNSTLASDVWLLSPDDTQEIDIMEAYGAGYSAGTQENQTWFAERVHISHHVFIRSPFQDYQPTDAGSWYYDGTTWRNDYHRFGVYWRDPFHLEYYIDGNLVRTVSGAAIIDPNNYTGGTGLSKAMDVIIDAEDQTWRSDQGLTPTDEELSNTENNTYKVDWIRFYKPVDDPTSAEDIKSNILEVFPNPFTEYILINTEGLARQLIICQPDGHVVKTKEVNSSSVELFTDELSSGFYILKVQHENGDWSSQKVIKL